MVTMTPEQATRFNHVSPVNATIVQRTLKCGCKPYEDVFTYNRWKAQGMQVQRGEHSINLALIKVVENECEDGSIERRKLFAHSHVFCRCQVKPIGYKPEVKPDIKPAAIEPAPAPVPDNNIMRGWSIV